MTSAENVKDLVAAGRRLRVYQVDVTNNCDGGCSYCPQPGHRRRRGFMSEETFGAVLDVASNRSMSLHHFSEPLLHPGIVGMVSEATRRGFRVGFSTNGKRLTQALLERLASAGLAWLRLHCNPFGVRLSSFEVPAGLLATEHFVGKQDEGPAKEMVSYGGHVGGVEEHDGHLRCSYLGYNGEPWRVVLWDGTVALCCVDVEGDAEPGGRLCRSCRGFVFDSPEDWGDYDGGGR